MKTRLLLLSNSTNPGEPYLGWPKDHIKDFLGNGVEKVLFVPFAGVSITYDEYYQAVSTQLRSYGYEVQSIHQLQIKKDIIKKFDAIVVGGGNTFQLTKMVQDHELLEPIRDAVQTGMPYIGWSAGSNLSCPTIMTTNDMPIVEPKSFEGLDLIPFQLNPHYTEATIPNHGGESRDMRINEFITMNKDKVVVGLPEGSLLRREGDQLHFNGKGQCRLFRHGAPVKLYADGEDLSWLLKL